MSPSHNECGLTIAHLGFALNPLRWCHGEVFGFDEGDTFSDGDSFTDGVSILNIDGRHKPALLNFLLALLQLDVCTWQNGPMLFY